jgi:hypothetical protein
MVHQGEVVASRTRAAMPIAWFPAVQATRLTVELLPFVFNVCYHISCFCSA